MPPMEEVPASKWFCPCAPNKPRFLGSHCRTSPRFSSMAIHIWLGIWKNITKLLPMGLMFAPGLMVLCLGTKVFIHGGFPTCSSIMLSNLGGPHPTRKNVGIYNHPICNYMHLCVVCNYFATTYQLHQILEYLRPYYDYATTIFFILLCECS